MFEYAVVGKGLFGAAAARRLSADTPDLVVIGPDEPADPSTHTGVFASHYDQGRLQRHMSRNLVWAILSHRAFAEYADIEAQSGIPFYVPIDSVHLAPRQKDSVFVEAAAETARKLAIPCTMIERGQQVMDRFPMLSFPVDSHGYIEHVPAGYTNPRELIRAQLAISARRGATVIPQTAIAIHNRGSHVEVLTLEGQLIRARRVLLTAGAYCNSWDLVPRKLAMRVKSEIILLARIGERERERLAGMPSMIYELEQPPLETIYMLPPIRYPDGQTYIKMGCNTEFDRYLSSPQQMGEWVRAGHSEPPRQAMEDAMRAIIPGLATEAVETKRCLITYTTEMWPYIDRLDGDRVFLATGGNGMGAKASVAIGRIAAELMMKGSWADDLDPRHFRARYEDELEGTGFSWGARGMAKRLPPGGEQPSVLDVPVGSPAERDRGAPGARPESAPTRLHRAEPSSFHERGGIRMSDVVPWPGLVAAPFSAAWAEVAPGHRSRRHMHHEAETWFVIAGDGLVKGDGEVKVSAGDSIYLPPFSEHEIVNPLGGGPLRFLTAWWTSPEAASGAARLVANGAATRAPGAASSSPRLVVTTTPPTPNGDLHLGHLAGPYLGGDIFARAQRMLGRDVLYVTGSDDYQSYVAGKALRTGQAPEQVADHYAARIQRALDRADVRCDVFTRSLIPSYGSAIQRMVETLYQQGHIVAAETDYLVGPQDGRSLFEYFVSGRCPHCGASAGGGCCEECGRFNEGCSLLEPVATLGGEPRQRRAVRRLVLPLSRHAARLRELVLAMPMSTRLRCVAEAMLADGLPDVPVTHPHDFGIACPIPGFEDQRISTWFEMGHNMLWGADARAADPSRPTEVVQFFGFDNGFYYALLYPLLYQLVDPGQAPPAALVCNEFYLLEGKKFSTSRDHAIWVNELLDTEPADLVRFALAHTRPEVERTSFSLPAYHHLVNNELRGTWSRWLRALGQRVATHFGGESPEPGLWTEDHRRVYRELEEMSQRLRERYGAAAFSTGAVTRELIALVHRTRLLAAAEAPLASWPGRRDFLRTAVALELAAARALAQGVAPIMPAFAQQLWSGLGLEGSVDAAGLPAELAWVPVGHRVVLAAEWFAALPADLSCAVGEPTRNAGAATSMAEASSTAGLTPRGWSS
jgi:methionyl-tRNA synthetase